MRLLPIPGVFQPPSDAWMLAAQLRGERLPPAAEILDLCTGSGVLAVAAARAHPGSRVVAVDISRRAVLAARLNARLNGVAVKAIRGDLFAPVARARFDLIVSNPPYVPGPRSDLASGGPSRAWEGGPDGRAILDRICARVSGHLKPGGAVLLVQNSISDERATIESLRGHGLDAEVVFRHRGTLGPILRARAGWLREQGLLGAEDRDEVVIVRGQRRDRP